VISPQQAGDLAREWVTAFNDHDLDGVLLHYADDVVFSSPAVIDVTREPTGTLHGKKSLREYFARALDKYPDLGFELLHILTGVTSVTIIYRSLHRGSLGAEVMTVNSEGKVSHVDCHYE
jgi:hypothetical protein